MKLIHIENVLILVNLILILYLVYVLSNRTIEKFYDVGGGLDPSVPGFQPHTHRDTGDDGCGDLCDESGGWERPPIPSVNGIVYIVSDNTLTISNIILSEEGIDHPFYDLWYIEIGIFQDGCGIANCWKTIGNINNDSITKISGSEHDIYNLSGIFNRNGTLKDDIVINLSADVTDDFRIYLGILDENMQGIPTLQNEDPAWNRFTFNDSLDYTPCANSDGACTSGGDCCGTAVCSSGTCQSTCSPNYYSNTDGICVVCPTYFMNSPFNIYYYGLSPTISGCTNCPAGTYRDSASVSDSASANGCANCPTGTYRNETMAECETCPNHQQPNEISGATDCVDCPAGFASDGTNACALNCYDIGKIPTSNKSGCVVCPSGQKPNPSDKNNCIPCDNGDFVFSGNCPDYYCTDATPRRTRWRLENVAETCPFRTEIDCTNKCRLVDEQSYFDSSTIKIKIKSTNTTDVKYLTKRSDGNHKNKIGLAASGYCGQRWKIDAEENNDFYFRFQPETNSECNQNNNNTDVANYALDYDNGYCEADNYLYCGNFELYQAGNNNNNQLFKICDTDGNIQSSVNIHQGTEYKIKKSDSNRYIRWHKREGNDFKFGNVTNANEASIVVFEKL